MEASLYRKGGLVLETSMVVRGEFPEEHTSFASEPTYQSFFFYPDS